MGGFEGEKDLKDLKDERDIKDPKDVSGALLNCEKACLESGPLITDPMTTDYFCLLPVRVPALLSPPLCKTLRSQSSPVTALAPR
jgi:hypothetical protein